MVPSRIPFATGRDLPPSILLRTLDGVLNLLYPDSCFLCATPVSRLQDRGICDLCWQKTLALRIVGPSCPSCGLPFPATNQESARLCGKCTLHLPPFSGARAFGAYSMELSCVIQALKFGGRRDLAGLLAPLLASTLVEYWPGLGMDLIVPVPLHPKRRRARGYNQAALLSRSLARLVGIPCRERALARVRNTAPQIGLSDVERAHNLRHAFRCVCPARIQGMRVLLVDDVMTTGSTVASASEALLAGGALRVSVLTVARAAPGIE